eukprot:224256-Pleurochrysis_carterae.AAC.1
MTATREKLVRCAVVMDHLDVLIALRDHLLAMGDAEKASLFLTLMYAASEATFDLLRRSGLRMIQYPR